MLPYGVLSAELIFGKVGNALPLAPKSATCDVKVWLLRCLERKWPLAGRSARTAGGLLRALAIQLLIFVVALVIAEGILRVIDLRYLRIYRAGAERIYNYDAELGWFPVPNS